MAATAEVVRRIDADGVDFRNDAQNKGNVSDVPVPAHCLDHSTLVQPLSGALDEVQREASRCRLTEAQVAHFEAHGWVAGVRVLSDADVAKLRADCDSIAAGHEARGLLYEYHSNQSGDSDNVLLHALGQWRLTPAFHALCYHLPIVVPVSQLLGDSANIKGFWQPTEEDVPLKGFIERHAEGKHAVRSPQIFASTGQQGDVEGHYKPILGEWGKQRL